MIYTLQKNRKNTNYFKKQHVQLFGCLTVFKITWQKFIAPAFQKPPPKKSDRQT